MFFYNNKISRNAIAKYCDISESMIAKYIKRCVDATILFKTDARGIYEVNPWLIAKGKWENIKELQASFQFIKGKWERTIICEE